jgi:hypothetical protein
MYASMLTSEFTVPRWVVLQLCACYTKFYNNLAVSSVLESGFETLGQTDAQLDDRVPRKVSLKEQAEKQVNIFYLTHISTEQDGSSNNTYGLYSVDTHFETLTEHLTVMTDFMSFLFPTNSILK